MRIEKGKDEEEKAHETEDIHKAEIETSYLCVRPPSTAAVDVVKGALRSHG